MINALKTTYKKAITGGVSVNLMDVDETNLVKPGCGVIALFTRDKDSGYCCFNFFSFLQSVFFHNFKSALLNDWSIPLNDSCFADLFLDQLVTFLVYNMLKNVKKTIALISCSHSLRLHPRTTSFAHKPKTFSLLSHIHINESWNLRILTFFPKTLFKCITD